LHDVMCTPFNRPVSTTEAVMKIDHPMRRTRVTHSTGARAATGARWLLPFVVALAACSDGDAPPAFSYPVAPDGVTRTRPPATIDTTVTPNQPGVDPTNDVTIEEEGVGGADGMELDAVGGSGGVGGVAGTGGNAGFFGFVPTDPAGDGIGGSSGFGGVGGTGGAGGGVP
jgi:hypothetical protein